MNKDYLTDPVAPPARGPSYRLPAARAFARILLQPLFVLLILLTAPASAQEVPAYVGSQVCADCHRDEAEAWARSDHALAWTRPGPDTVVADFDGTSFHGSGMDVRFRIDGDTYRASVTESDGSTRDYEVHSVVGIRPLQQYLFETEPGRLQSFDVVWDTEKKAWFHLYPEQDLPPSDGLHWSGPYKNWNARCAECHATGYSKNFDPVAHTYASTQAEIGVGCEACHGPGQAHIEWTTGKAPQSPLTPYGFTMDFDKGAEATIQQCAGCHSRREAQGDGNPLPGTPYHDAYTLSLLQPGMYHADGQILDEVYVYGSFLQSRMYARGVSCTNCHDVHSSELVAEGNAVCAQCHSPAGNPDFPTLTLAEYDSPAHHFHQPDTAGAQCKNCHMVEQTYMGNDRRADHSFRVPRPDLSPETGAPDACTTCHAGQSAEWAARTIEEWYPDSTHRGPHYGQVLAAGRVNPALAMGDLIDLSEDRTQADLVRATALWLATAAADPSVAERVAPLMQDPSPLVRAAAVRLQRAAPPTEMVSRIVPLLADPMRTVRIETVKLFVGAPIARLPKTIEASYRRAMTDWQTAMGNRMDFPETHLVLGGIALTTRNFPAAENAFREVTRLDPQRSDAWQMRVRIASALRGPEAAREVLKEARSNLPEDVMLQEFEKELNQ